ncbi:MAG TPA: glycosyltransferase family 2 protein [Solirubrobacteraceae bacterium]|nr:glycosyltransferase family 2 protein [Solirubrobacteraceae bacterium]
MDVVVPFGGKALGPVLARAGALQLREGDTVTVVDNRARPEQAAALPPGVRLVAAPEVASSYFARNAGARAGRAPWILFLDADVEPPPDHLDRLLDPPPAERVAVVAGEVLDEEPRPGDPPAVRWAWLRRSMSQGGLRDGFAETANCAIRRAAFEAAGGFREHVRSGGDADLGFRLRAAGWELELREQAAVVHRSRRTIARLLAQQAKHGSGAGWMAREHPGSFPARSLPGVVRWGLRRAAAGIAARRRGDRDEAVVALLDGPTLLAFELGRRLVPNRARQRR